jgi:general bacterial porin, GBP family
MAKKTGLIALLPIQEEIFRMKKLCPLIAGLLAVPAFAQSSVTLYGVADVNVEVSNSGFGYKTRIQSGGEGGSRIGFKGTEDLGGGLKANFLLEAGIAIDTGQLHNINDWTGNTTGGTNQSSNAAAPNATTIFQRASWAGLSGGFGEVRIGRQYTPLGYTYLGADPLAYSTVATLACCVMVGPSSFNASQSTRRIRADNSISYTTPVLSGFSAMGLASTGFENNTNTTSDHDGRGWSLSAQYAQGPIWVSAAYEEINTTIGSATTGREPVTKDWLVGATYDLTFVKLYASYNSGKGIDATSTTVQDATLIALGLIAPLGPGKLSVSIARMDDKLATNADAKFYGVAYSYPLSKRTDLYAAAATIREGNAAATYGLRSGEVTALTINPATPGYSPKAYSVGMRHTF